jgi:ribosomal protein S24E
MGSWAKSAFESAGWHLTRLDDATSGIAAFRARRYTTLTRLLYFPHTQDNSAPVTIRTRKFTTNRLLSRRQFIVDVLHPLRPPISRTDVSEKLAAIYKTDKARVVTFGFKTHFGGGRSTGFALIYDSEEVQRKFEPKYRLVRVSGNPMLSVLPASQTYGLIAW